MRHKLFLPLSVVLGVFASCNNNAPKSTEAQTKDSLQENTYAYDAAFLKKHTGKVVELSDAQGQSRVLLSADYQGRVMTSTASGDKGVSFGWLNYSLIAANSKKAQFNPVGGEERFWMGPEGGQYSLYFKAKDSFSIANWQVPAIIDTLPYDITSASSSAAQFSKRASFTNYSGTQFDIQIERGIKLLSTKEIEQRMNCALPAGIGLVGYESSNSIENVGTTDWSKERGLVSIWLLGMFTPTPQTVVIIPFKPGAGSRQLITDSYFGSIPAERLKVLDSVLYFTCDGKYRSKIGLSPLIAKPVAASFDFKNNTLTFVLPTIDAGGMYVNSKWELQKEPYKGDVINSYNDGPLQDGSQLGPFYEIESSSATRALKKGEKLTYNQVTCHLQGDYNALREVAMKMLHVELNDLKK